MPDVAARERLQPSLLDRLTDEKPHEGTEASEQRALTLETLRKTVKRDLGWLLDATNLSAVHELEPYPEVARSVLNFGLPDLAGRTASGIDAPELEGLLRNALLAFEPRLLRSTLRVRLVMDEASMAHNALTFEIEGELCTQPMPVRIFLRSELDLEGGGAQVTELTGAGKS